jgi:predicted transcriptional regulator
VEPIDWIRETNELLQSLGIEANRLKEKKDKLKLELDNLTTRIKVGRRLVEEYKVKHGIKP